VGIRQQLPKLFCLFTYQMAQNIICSSVNLLNARCHKAVASDEAKKKSSSSQLPRLACKPNTVLPSRRCCSGGAGAECGAAGGGGGGSAWPGAPPGGDECHPGCGPGCDNLITVGLRSGTAGTQGAIKYLTSYALISLFFVWSTNFFVCFFLGINKTSLVSTFCKNWQEC
jgi:hypothetical protein